MAGEVKFKRCPHCGEAGFARVKRWPWEMEGEPGLVWGYHVICDASGIDTHPRGCGASSGWAETPEEAITAWNRRPADPDLVEALREIETICTESASDCRKRMGTRVGNVLVTARAALAKAGE